MHRGRLGVDETPQHPRCNEEHQVASHYNVAETVSTRIPRLPRLVRGAAQLPACGHGLPPLEELWRREVGTPITDHRTSWVRRVATPTCNVYVKTYEYATW